MWLIVAIAALICDAVPASLYIVLACTGLFFTVKNLVQSIGAEKPEERIAFLIAAVIASALAVMHMRAAGF